MRITIIAAALAAVVTTLAACEPKSPPKPKTAGSAPSAHVS